MWFIRSINLNCIANPIQIYATLWFDSAQTFLPSCALCDLEWNAQMYANITRLFTYLFIGYCQWNHSFFPWINKSHSKSKQSVYNWHKDCFSAMIVWDLHAVCLLVGCLTSQQQASVSQGRICSDNFTCCHTEIEVADQTFYLTQSQYTDTGPTSPSADPITPGAWQGSHWSANV